MEVEDRFENGLMLLMLKKIASKGNEINFKTLLEIESKGGLVENIYTKNGELKPQKVRGAMIQLMRCLNAGVVSLYPSEDSIIRITHKGKKLLKDL